METPRHTTPHETYTRQSGTIDALRHERAIQIESEVFGQVRGFVEHLQSAASGQKMADLLSGVRVADFGRDELDLYPLLHAAAEGPEQQQSAERLVVIKQLSDQRVSVEALVDNYASEEEFMQALQEHYQASPYAQRLAELAGEVGTAFMDDDDDDWESEPDDDWDEAPGGGAYESLRLAGRLSDDDPADQDVARYLRKEHDAGYSPLRVTERGIEFNDAQVEHNLEQDSAFIYSADARALLDAFDASGAVLSDHAKQELTNEQESRTYYGGAYNWVTNQICNLAMDRPGRLFADDALPTLAYTGDTAADTTAALINQLSERGSNRHSDITPAEDGVFLGTGRNTEQKFIDAMCGGYIAPVEIEGRQFLQVVRDSTHWINLEPVTMNGVSFPPGTVWARPHGQVGYPGYAPLRLSAFCFDQDTADQVMGKEFAAIDPAAKQRAFQSFAHYMQNAATAKASRADLL